MTAFRLFSLFLITGIALGCTRKIDSSEQEAVVPVEIGGNKIASTDEPEKSSAISLDKALLEENERLKAELATLKNKEKVQLNKTSKSPVLKKCIVLHKNTVRREKEGPFEVITGIVENRTGTNLVHLRISFNVFDKDGVQVENSVRETENLADGAKWRFSALIFNQSSNYKCAEISSTKNWPWKEE